MTDEDKDAAEDIRQAAHSILKQEVTHLQLVPSVAVKLLKLTHDDNARADDLTRIIETEPTLAARILRNVNSAAFYLPNKTTSIKRAVNILGFSSVRQLALNLLFYNRMIKHDPKQQFNQLFFWQHCLFVASLSRAIAVALKHPDPDLVYTAGLLHDIGKVVLETYGRVTYSDFIESAGNNRQLTVDDERSFFGISHTEIGHVFCLEWQLPEAIKAVVACHHQQPEHDSPFAEYKTEIAIVSFANYIAWVQGIGSIPNHSHPALQQAVLETINIDKLDIERLLHQVDIDMENTREFYGIEFPNLHKLRATLIKATISLSQLGTNSPEPKPTKRLSASLTAPHQSLYPDDFVPKTLAAIQNEFSFDRIIMLISDTKKRSLIATHCWPPTTLSTQLLPVEIDIPQISGKLLTCLRDKKAVLIKSKSDPQNPFIKYFQAAEFITLPVLRDNSLVGLLYADNAISKKPLLEHLLADIMPIADELGIALINARQYDTEKKRAQLDPLTQLYNKRMIDQFLTQLFNNDIRTLNKTAIGFVDVDKFKKFNDLCGHQAGDDALRIVADILRSLTRPTDFIGRYGGEEFLFVLKNTDESGAFAYAERIRKEIERRGKILSQRFNNHLLTASIGVATYKPSFTHYTQMIETADQAMYQAKKDGRNRIILFSD
ncbi:MAG: HDOD domain-containing protein [Methylococcales bacterium]|nr:HDOD domain-containing protein [Methylococcaceae bacterium]